MKQFRVSVYEGSRSIDYFKVWSVNNISALSKAQQECIRRKGLQDKDVIRCVSFSGLNVKERSILVKDGNRNRKYTIQISY